MLFSLGWRSASCRVENRPRAPGIAVAIERSSPSTWCHDFVATCFWSLWIDASISCSRCARCAGSVSIFLRVLTTHPSTIFVVAQVASPFSIFLMEAGSCLCGLWFGCSGRSTLSSACNKTRLTSLRRAPLPCTNPMKLSTYTSQYLQGSFQLFHHCVAIGLR